MLSSGYTIKYTNIMLYNFLVIDSASNNWGPVWIMYIV